MRKSKGAGDKVAAVTPEWCGMGRHPTHLWDSVSPCDVFGAGYRDPGFHGRRVVELRPCLQRLRSSCSNRNGPDSWTSVSHGHAWVSHGQVSVSHKTSECNSRANVGVSRTSECVSWTTVGFSWMSVSHGQVCLTNQCGCLTDKYECLTDQ